VYGRSRLGQVSFTGRSLLAQVTALADRFWHWPIYRQIIAETGQNIRGSLLALAQAQVSLLAVNAGKDKTTDR
jgi:hypothetical protein